MAKEAMENEVMGVEEVEEEEDEEEQQIEGWDDWLSDEEEPAPDYLCLFCSLRFDSTEALFDHCSSVHCFDFQGIVKKLKLDFYGSFRLINYIRSQVAENRCWSCGLVFQCNKDLQNHLHAAVTYEKDEKFLWENDLYLRPFMEDDALLHGFATDEDEEDYNAVVDKEELLRELISSRDLAELCNDSQSFLKIDNSDLLLRMGNNEACAENKTNHCEKMMTNGIPLQEDPGTGLQKQDNRQPRVSIAHAAAREIKSINDNYFGAYGSFGIHREMLSDKVRMDAYRGALLNNPSLMNQATVLDVGSGTGILSLFAAQAGASRVIAVEASAKMANMATQIAKENGLLKDVRQNGEEKHCSGVISVVHCMVEELEKHVQVPPGSIDVLVSEWMGYCLLYESMLSSVIYARDHWLKPGGAILPDTATIFGAGFGRGGTSLPFWEDVYGFNLACIGKEVVKDAAHAPIVDTVDSQDIVTEPAVLHTFDLATMKPDEMDFTASFELKLRSGAASGCSTSAESGTSYCYGIILWFETGFTSRFCKEMPTILSTSPYSPKTHWSQTILTFQEPIAMTSAENIAGGTSAVGTRECPAMRIRSRISIARSSEHRSIDISVETTAISSDGRKCSWPVQLFNL